MDELQNTLDMQSLDTITDRILQYTPPRNLISQLRTTPADVNEPTQSVSIPDAANDTSGETPRYSQQD